MEKKTKGACDYPAICFLSDLEEINGHGTSTVVEFEVFVEMP
jgi:hypothetical protein